MTERDYEVIAMQLGRLQYALDKPEMLAERFDQAVEMIADVLEHNSKRFKRARFYVDVYSDSKKAIEKTESAREKKSSFQASVLEL